MVVYYMNDGVQEAIGVHEAIAYTMLLHFSFYFFISQPITLKINSNGLKKIFKNQLSL